MNCYSFTKLPAPKIGNTIGHGVNEGICPYKKESMEHILEKINNYSIDS